MILGEKGICRLSLIPVRGKAGDSYEMVTQLLFGDHYEVIEVSNDIKWLRVKILFDGYVGWIDAKQHTTITEEYFEQINHSNYKISLDISSSILHKKNHINVLMGSVLPISTNEMFKMEEQLAFNGESKSLGEKRDFEYLKQIALKYINAPYSWGGKSPFGIDCSGFTQQVFRICGYSLKRDAYQQFEQGASVDKDVLPGDLVFFKNDASKITHVGIAFGEGSIIHASGKVRIDKLDNEGIYNEELRKYTHQLAGIRRILKA
ncbi:MAG: C40 family peptidase [Cyclobacteriaceae bacterium]|nr:C40 family peptidase [Cyclobacteriaceae bacterium]